MLRNRSTNRLWAGASKFAIFAVLGGAGVLLAACESNDKTRRGFSPSEYGVPASQRVVEMGQPVPRGGGKYRVGKPYQVRGKWYEPAHKPGYRARGTASWYGDDFHGRKTANGEIYNMYALSAAHPTLPMPSYVRVTNTDNGRSVVVRINDRGPYHSNRVIDLSKRAAKILGISGLGNVDIAYLDKKAPVDGRDEAWLAAQVQENGTPMTQHKVATLSPVPAWAMMDPEGQNTVRAALADVLPKDGADTNKMRGGAYAVASLNTVPPTGEEIGIEALQQGQYASYQRSQQPVALMAQADAAPAIVSNQLVQVGVYRDAAEAVRYRDSLQKFGPAKIEINKAEGVTLYQLKLGPFENMAQAQAALAGAQEQGAAGAQLIRM